MLKLCGDLHIFCYLDVPAGSEQYVNVILLRMLYTQGLLPTLSHIQALLLTASLPLSHSHPLSRTPAIAVCFISECWTAHTSKHVSPVASTPVCARLPPPRASAHHRWSHWAHPATLHIRGVRSKFIFVQPTSPHSLTVIPTLMTF